MVLSVKWAVTTAIPVAMAAVTTRFSLVFRRVRALRAPTRCTSEGIIMAIRGAVVEDPAAPGPIFGVVYTVSCSPMGVTTPVPVVCVGVLAEL